MIKVSIILNLPSWPQGCHTGVCLILTLALSDEARNLSCLASCMPAAPRQAVAAGGQNRSTGRGKEEKNHQGIQPNLFALKKSFSLNRIYKKWYLSAISIINSQNADLGPVPFPCFSSMKLF